MQFREIKPGYTLYFFNRNDVSLKQVKVLDVSVPHFDSRFPGSNISEMVVDITVEGENKQYTFKEKSSSAVVGDIIISTTIDSALNDVEALIAQSQQALSQHDKLQNNIQKCKEILTNFSPKYKKEQETEQRFGKIEESINKMEKLMYQQQEMISNFIKETKA